MNAQTGFDSGGNVTSGSNQQSKPDRKDATGGVPNYPVKKPAGLNPGNLPHRTQDSGSDYRPHNNGSGGNPMGVD